MGNSKFKIVAETMAEYDTSQFHPRSLNCVLSLDDKQAQAVCALHSLLGKTKVEQHLAIVDHFFKTPNLKSEKNQKCRAPKFLVDPLEGPSMRQCGSGWNLGHDPNF